MTSKEKLNQKSKLLLVLQYLLEHSEPDRPVTTKELIDYVESMGLTAQRKSIYSDLEQLRELGFDIVKIGGRKASYFIGERLLSRVEIRMLADMIAASAFLTAEKTADLIKRLAKLLPLRQRNLLLSEVHLAGMASQKTTNEAVYRNLDRIRQAMEEQRNLHFYYADWQVDRSKPKIQIELKRRHEGEEYRIYPHGLLWDREHYYLVAEDLKEAKVKHYRPDRMEEVHLGKTADKELIHRSKFFDPLPYQQSLFDMFNGHDSIVTLAFTDDLLPVMLDRFGHDSIVENYRDSGWLKTNQVIKTSPIFYSWLASFGSKIILLSPQGEIRAYRAFLEEALAQTEPGEA